MLLLKGFHLVFKIFKNALLLMVIAMILFIAYRGNQPMSVPQAPQGLTYFEFMADRIDAAKTVKPSQCGWGMMLSLAVLGPIYSVVYTTVAIYPDSALAKGTAPDPDIARDVAGATWYEIPDIWWKTVERLSWTMLGKSSKSGCHFRSVEYPFTGKK